MLRWSAETTGRTVEIAAIADPSAEPGLRAGRELLELALVAVGRRVDAGPVTRLAAVLGAGAAVDAAAVAANFELMNRVVDAVGLPFGKGRAARMADEIAVLGLERFPHAGS